MNTFIDVTLFERAAAIGLLEDFDDVCAAIQDRHVLFLVADDEGPATRPRPGLALERQDDTAVEDDPRANTVAAGRTATEVAAIPQPFPNLELP